MVLIVKIVYCCHIVHNLKKMRIFIWMVLICLLSSCAPSSRHLPSLHHQAVSKSWSLLHETSIYSVPVETIDQNRVMSLFWNFVDPEGKFNKDDRNIFNSKREAFERAVKGEDLSPIDQLIENIPGERSMVEWHVYFSWINAIAKTVDPLASYYPPSMQEQVDLMVKASSQGTGIELYEENGRVFVKYLNPRGPSSRSGVQTGDELLFASNKDGSWSSQDGSFSDAQRRVRGSAKSEINIKVLRAGKEISFLIEGDHWVEPSLRPSLIKKGDYYIVRVPLFYKDEDPVGGWLENTEMDVSRLLDEIPSGALWVLDLRGNPGGVLEQALDVASVFGAQGLAWELRGRRLSSQVFLPSSDASPRLPAAVWVDKSTASSAEALASVLMARGVVIVGEETYGKNTTQMLFPLDPWGQHNQGYSKSGFLLISSSRASWSNGLNGSIVPSCAVEELVPTQAQTDQSFISLTQKCLKV